MQERRKQPRRNLMSYSQVFDLSEGRLIGYLGDLNLRGAMVIADQPLEIDSRLIITIQLPELPDLSVSRLDVPVRIARCHPDLSPDYLNIGMEFDLITAEQSAIIEAVIENYEFRREPPNYPPHPAELEE
ncbi:MAG TPA: PilZ domain-containing protein [Anaerolineales bacterium]|nr:PilZ domain-containing protein [Anaerolineales bacterium]